MNNFLDTLSKKFLFDFDFVSRDIIDLLIIAFFVYVVIRLLKETHSISVVIGILILAIFYGVALIFDLAFTILVLRSFFSVFLIIVAIIFQRELRRFFSFFGFLGVAGRLTPPSSAVLGMISKTIERLAKEKSGLLVVFPGIESIERHLEGGHRLNGEISEPLLLSIFDKTSPGHDGAVIIKNDRIKKFGVHLPLAERVQKASRFGLRHRAGLGLSERSDAFIVIVSEERGTINIAQRGSLRQVFNAEELRESLFDFYKEKFPKRKLGYFFNLILKNLILFFVSVFIALIFFFLVNSKLEVAQRGFIVPFEFRNVPDGILISEIEPQEALLTLKGRSSDFSAFQYDAFKVIIDLNQVKNADTAGWRRISIDPKSLKLPINLSFVKIDPSVIRIQLVESQSPK
ncbi:MAG: diadenylate cyclase [Patescibacteria group bacterium]